MVGAGGGRANSGGGATDFRVTQGEYKSRFLIAGGGGGTGSGNFGAGGGLIGGDYNNTPYTGGNQTHAGIYSNQYVGTLSGGFGYGYSASNSDSYNAGGGGGLFGGSRSAGGSGFVYSEDKTPEIENLPDSIKVDNPELSYSTNIGHGYAIITSLSPSECKCVQKCICSNEGFFLRNFHAVPFMYSYLFKS
ncbi:hypothetical protein TVAG_033280 [Trichomonas vaginalis G3]|uniref:receptor protein-tyrosine kinase n=1 Tax=Trichomonas vaginalis (strain ATCC PRA-98 / G3) TaxID=412133 RepID=A2FIZ3_TRIV3|nr:hypothetical protein TVAG_033280 [Trichomonas vaginalis G3]|eukprot:XP_001308038.1 hypothetical protein [Trichomonas vaginalis G3]